MKKIILSALAGALGMFLMIFGIAAVSVTREKAQEPTAYVHVDYVSELTQEDWRIDPGNLPLRGASCHRLQRRRSAAWSGI